MTTDKLMRFTGTPLPETPAEASVLMLQLLAQMVRTNDASYGYDVLHTLSIMPAGVRASVAGALDVAANGQLIDCPLCVDFKGMLPEEVGPHIIDKHRKCGQFPLSALGIGLPQYNNDSQPLPQFCPYCMTGLEHQCPWHTAESAPHQISIVPAHKMDTPGLFAAVCSCGEYRSAPDGESGARKAGEQHVAAKHGRGDSAPNPPAVDHG